MKKHISKILVSACTTALAVTLSIVSTVGFASGSAHTHEFSTEWSQGEENHWHAATCGDDIVKDVAPHSFVGGVCSVCGYEKPVVHVHTYSNEWSADSVNHWHAADCGHDIVRDMASHDFVNGKCSVCDYPEPEHESVHIHTFSDEWSSDSVNHWHASTCGDKLIADAAAHTLRNGVCTVCGYGELIIPEIDVTDSGAYEEGIYAEWSSSADEDYFVYYKKTDSENWVAVDDNLIRTVSTVNRKDRVDIVGIAAGNYDVKICTYDNYEEVSSQQIIENVAVTAYDRSGYAHFNYTGGVGGYKDDGTPKDNAVIIYVTEQTKNSVTATFGSNTYTGIVPILANAQKSPNPIIVRVIGRIAAATWQKLEYTKTDANTDEDDNLLASAIVGLNGKQLPTTNTSTTLTQAALISGGYNKLQTDITELSGLSSKATYSSGAYDSAWNNCSVSGAKNVTVEGIGTDAEIYQWGFTWVSCNSIEVRNLTFNDYTEDACSFEGPSSENKTSATAFSYTNFWVHHNTFNRGKNNWDLTDEQDKHDGDGSVDLKRLANVTVSYNHFYNTHKTGLVGADDASCTANVTFHHNYYESCESRLPLARVANMHMYNNYYKGLGNTGTGLSIRAGGYAFVEYCYFDDQHTPVATQLGTKNIDGYEKLQGFIKLYNCTFVNSSYTATDYIKVADNRADRFANDNIYNQYFDTDPTAFYYDSVNGVSKVTSLITNVNELPSLIPVLAGAHSKAV